MQGNLPKTPLARLLAGAWSTAFGLRMAPFLLGLPISAAAWSLSTPVYTLTFADGLWTWQDSVIHDTVNMVTNLSGYPVELLGLRRSGGIDLDAEAAKRAAILFPAQGDPLKTWDSLETLGTHGFQAAEWRNPSAQGTDSALRARTYALRAGDILFIATLRYRPGGCPSTLFTLRNALATLVLGDPAPVRPGRWSGTGIALSPALPSGRDALGRYRKAGGWIRILHGSGKGRTGNGGEPKAARIRELSPPLPYHGCADPRPQTGQP